MGLIISNGIILILISPASGSFVFLKPFIQMSCSKFYFYSLQTLANDSNIGLWGFS